MKIINLDPKFNPFGEDGRIVEIQTFSFPSGCEPHIKLPPIHDNWVRITCRIKTCNDIILLMLAVDALRRAGTEIIEVLIPYLPFARQDRVMVKGEPLSVKVVADLINSMKLEKVWVYDVHSEVSLALINNVECISNYTLAANALFNKENYVIVSPDAGAYKKIFKLCQELKYQGEIVMCNKIRDVSNGVIRSLTCSHGDLEGKDAYIVDDICDGGGTFVLLAEELRKRNCGAVNLIVSHAIMSKGMEALAGIDRVYTTDSFKDHEHHNSLTVYPMEKLIGG